MSGPPPPRPSIPPGNNFASQTRAYNQESIRFGNQELSVFPNPNISFRSLSHISLDKEEKCLLNNLWISYNSRNQKDRKYFLACMNALSEHFHSIKTNYKFYVVLKGKTTGVFHTWREVLDSISNFPDPLYEVFNSVSEAFDTATRTLGLNYFISPSLRTVSDPPLDFSPFKDPSNMQNNFKRLNEHIELLQKEKQELLWKISDLEKKIVETQTQTATGKDSSSPLMAVALPRRQETQTQSQRPRKLAVGESSRKGIMKNMAKKKVATGKDSSSPLMAVALPKRQETQTQSQRPRKLAVGESSRKGIKKNMAKKKEATGKDSSNPLMAVALPKRQETQTQSHIPRKFEVGESSRKSIKKNMTKKKEADIEDTVRNVLSTMLQAKKKEADIEDTVRNVLSTMLQSVGLPQQRTPPTSRLRDPQTQDSKRRRKC